MIVIIMIGGYLHSHHEPIMILDCQAPHSWGFLFGVMCTGYGYYNLPYIDGVSCLWDDG